MATKDDLPADFAQPDILLLKENEFSPEIKSLRTTSGYRGYYLKQPATKSSLWISHYVILFPEEMDAWAMADTNVAMFSSAKSTKPSETLVCPPVGDRCYAGRYFSHSLTSTEEEEHLYISFTKGNIFVSLWTAGQNSDYDMLKDLAVKMNAKIP